jgi:hypothetical protein
MYPGSGFITIIIYATGAGGRENDFDILTETGDIVLTEDGLPLEIEH